MPKVKIISTLGPASAKEGVLLKMVQAGMDVVRLNFSHGTQEEHLSKIRFIREINKRYRRHIRILGDLEGYRVRVGKFKDGSSVEVKKHQLLRLVPGHVTGTHEIIPFDFPGSLKTFEKGQHVFIDDGNVDLIVEFVKKDFLIVRATASGIIKEHKGINIPDVRLDIKGLAAHDKPNILFGLEHKLDFLAQSFVRNREDMRVLKKFMRSSSHKPGLIAKIENREGIRNIDGILKECDGIMVARGDMGVSLPVYEVPMIQKAIIYKCNQAGKFVITATQMLESMTVNRLPTRAEVADVANAILDGTDYVMLSAETSVGIDPTGCVHMMNKIIKFTENNRTFRV